MKLLWVCNQIPGQVRKHIGAGEGSALWVDRVFDAIRTGNDSLHVLCRGGNSRGNLDDLCSYTLFPELVPHQYSSAIENLFAEELMRFQPDVIHIWGSEYSHTLAMVNAAEKT